MIGEFDLRDLLNSYGIDYKKVLKNNVNVISNGEYEEIKSVLSFLVKKVGISPKSIEKCPSILYLNTDNISQNYNFLLEHNFDKRRIERCLHVLSAKPSDLEGTYDYVTDKYGRRYIVDNLSILAKSKRKIQAYEDKFGEVLQPSVLFSAIVSRRNSSEDGWTYRGRELFKFISQC